jgi:hypothetical protein
LHDELSRKVKTSFRNEAFLVGCDGLENIAVIVRDFLIPNDWWLPDVSPAFLATWRLFGASDEAHMKKPGHLAAPGWFWVT